MFTLKEALNKVNVYRFEIFKGEVDENGKVQKVKSVGSAYIRDGIHTYAIHLRMFLKDTFYLIKNMKAPVPEYVLLTREPSIKPTRKYFWNNVGEGRVLGDENEGLIAIKFDLLDHTFYMKHEPFSVTEADAIETEENEKIA